MRIAFLGKGGSGKTTLASLFAKYIIGKKFNLISVDADINVHLGAALDIATTPKFLSEYYKEIYLYLEG